MKRIAILTWFNSGRNYGQTLQAAAIYHTLKSLGYDCEVLYYGNSNHNSSRYKKWKYYNSLSQENKILQKKFDRFVEENLTCSKYLKNKLAVEKYINENNFDCVICGSDQIWNPFSLDSVFYLNLNITAKKIAYAASIFDKKYIAEFEKYPEVANWLMDFYAISTRENTGAEIVEKLTDGKIVPSVVLDPTLMVDKEHWVKMANKATTICENYILCYMFDITQEQVNFIEEYAKKTGCKRILSLIPFDVISDDISVTTFDNISVEEFLTFILYAKAVITDSFHGTAFSIIFQKDFYVIDNGVQANADKYYNIDRMNTLLEKVGLSERMFGNNPINQMNNLSEIDYVKVNDTLCKEREISKSFLVSAIEGKV